MQNLEIERKYLVTNSSYLSLATQVVHIEQGYLSVDADCTIRVRLRADHAFLTVKGKNQEGGIAHFEWEKPIDTNDALQLLRLCKHGVVCKDRYIVPWHELLIEVDVFHGQNERLIMAEIELPDSNYPLPPLPDFIGEEVTSDSRFYNSYLSLHPFSTWQK